MTTITEAAKRVGSEVPTLERASIAVLKRDPVLAQQFARRLCALASQVAPVAEFSIEDLRDVLDLAVGVERADEPRIVEGRYLRKRLREQCAFADRYGESFALVVLKLAPEPSPGLYARTMENVVAKLRRSDRVTVYRRRVVILFPRVRHSSLGPLIGRVRDELEGAAGRAVVVASEHLVYPSDAHRDTQAVLDWLEDALRAD
jgi:hypothetical protein